MMVLIKRGTLAKDIKKIQDVIRTFGYSFHTLSGYDKIAIQVESLKNENHIAILKTLSGIENIVSIENPYFLVSKEFKNQNTIIDFNGTSIGKTPTIIAGPCSVESYDQVNIIAAHLNRHNVHFLRGGTYKPRTSPYSFQGLEEEGLEILRDIADKYGMFVVSEALGIESFYYVEKYADIIQIGSRNMQNFPLLKRAGKSNKPILLKRGFMSTIDEFLSAAEYILLHGNQNVILCERGIRTYETKTRFTLDISAIPVLKELTHLPIIVDPSHAAGKRSLVLPLTRASLAVGADGVMVEVHNDPDNALSDGKQSLTLDMFEKMAEQINREEEIRFRMVS